MTPHYLQTLGFLPTTDTASRQPAFSDSWRYQNEVVAQDGVTLFIERPLGIASCRLSTLAAPLAAHDIFASVPLHDHTALETAITAFYAAHGGRDQVAVPFVPFSYLPYRRKP